MDAEVALLLLEGGLSDRRLRNGLAGATLAVSGWAYGAALEGRGELPAAAGEIEHVGYGGVGRVSC